MPARRKKFDHRQRPPEFPPASNRRKAFLAPIAKSLSEPDQKAARRKRLSDPHAIDEHIHSAIDGHRRYRGEGWAATDYDELLMEKRKRFRAVVRWCFPNDDDFDLFLMVMGEVFRAVDAARERGVPKYKITREVQRIRKELDERLRNDPDLREALLKAWRELFTDE